MSERYTIISADCHAGGSHAQYREYLESKWHDEFDESMVKARVLVETLESLCGSDVRFSAHRS